MSVKRKRGNITRTMPGAIGLGLCIGITLLLVGCAVLAWLVISEKVDMNSIGFGNGIILILSSGIGAWLAAALAGSKRLQVIGIFAAVFFAVLLSMTALLFGGQYSGILVNGTCILAGAGGVLLLGKLPKKAKVSRRKIKAYR